MLCQSNNFQNRKRHICLRRTVKRNFLSCFCCDGMLIQSILSCQFIFGFLLYLLFYTCDVLLSLVVVMWFIVVLCDGCSLVMCPFIWVYQTISMCQESILCSRGCLVHSLWSTPLIPPPRSIYSFLILLSAWSRETNGLTWPGILVSQLQASPTCLPEPEWPPLVSQLRKRVSREGEDVRRGAAWPSDKCSHAR